MKYVNELCAQRTCEQLVEDVRDLLKLSGMEIIVEVEIWTSFSEIFACSFSWVTAGIRYVHGIGDEMLESGGIVFLCCVCQSTPDVE